MFEIRAFDPASDTAPLAALHAVCFDDAWDAASLRAMLATPAPPKNLGRPKTKTKAKKR